jgi:D-alanyl-D-alanine carboxypeptidase
MVAPQSIRRLTLVYGFLTLGCTASAAIQVQPRYASLVVEAQTGRVLHEVNADTRNQPASLTKMMTLYLVFEALEQHRLRLSQGAQVSTYAASVEPSRLGLRASQIIVSRRLFSP